MDRQRSAAVCCCAALPLAQREAAAPVHDRDHRRGDQKRRAKLARYHDDPIYRIRRRRIVRARALVAAGSAAAFVHKVPKIK